MGTAAAHQHFSGFRGATLIGKTANVYPGYSLWTWSRVDGKLVRQARVFLNSVHRKRHISGFFLLRSFTSTMNSVYHERHISGFFLLRSFHVFFVRFRLFRELSLQRALILHDARQSCSSAMTAAVE